jgi:hypothetical protein
VDAREGVDVGTVDGQPRAVQSCDRSSGAWTVNYLHTEAKNGWCHVRLNASLRFRSW